MLSSLYFAFFIPTIQDLGIIKVISKKAVTQIQHTIFV